ncbi:hypothetical protein GWI33_016090 [Rhynchophorus ferrugineus]|uniref:Uncharacterized protein n=1 Tax=Rhynchophorus ferrugineus TaxID=354439 RepID=A0A834I1H6_RHYFE|nr:hypothetical protein GWI33_016090 [Rhynchophorus ferrugineus]
MTEKQPTCSKISSSEFLLSELPDDSPSSSSAETVNSKEQIVENQQQQKMEGEEIDLYQFEQEALNKINSIKCEVEHLKEEILIFDKDTLKSLFGRYEELLILKTLDLDDIETRVVFYLFYSAQLAAARADQRSSCVGLEGSSNRKLPPPLLRSRTLPAIVVPGVNILQAQLGNYVRNNEQYLQPPQHHVKSSLAGRLSVGRVSFSRDDTAPLETRRKSAISRLCGSGHYGPERSEDGGLMLRVPSPHVVAARAYRMSSSPQPGPSSSGAFSRISKLLIPGSSKNQIVVDDSNVTRRLSWERRDPGISRLPRSSSIDSMVEAVWSEAPVSPSEPLPVPVVTEKRYSLRPDRALALVSPGVGRRVKGQRATNGK